MKKIIFAIVMATACTSPKIVEQHHYHYEQSDTLAIQALVDKHMSGWHAQMDSSWRQTWREYSASLYSNDEQKERITETITTYIDSLGREVRQEQRTTDRTLSKMQQQTEQHLASELEARLSVAIDSVNNAWQQRFDVIQTHFERSDSSSYYQAPADTLPWYKYWWQSTKDSLLIIAIIALLLMTRNIWFPWLTNLLRR